jgi:hypothetical protein
LGNIFYNFEQQEEIKMAHNVKFTIPKRTLGTSDIEFEVKQNGIMFGTLKISKGSLVWFPKGTTKGLKMGWTKFDKIMDKNATRIERR